MANKCRIIYDDKDKDATADGLKDGDSSAKRTRRVSDNRHTSSPRRSVCSGRGNGGRLAQLKSIERKQTENVKRPSRVDLAMQVLSQNLAAEPPQPVFALAAPGQGYGFRLPDTASQTANIAANPVASKLHTFTVIAAPRSSVMPPGQPEINTQSSFILMCITAAPAPRVHDDADEIDEDSPSEDDSVAPTPTHQPSHSLSGNAIQVAENVLLATRHQQMQVGASNRDAAPTAQVAACPQEILPAAETGNNDRVVTDADASKLKSKPVGPTTEGAELWQLQYYSPSIHDIIEHAKQFSHCDAVSINAFLMRPTFNSKVVEYINKVITEHQQRCLNVSNGWWPHHLSGITKLLWKDLGNWCSALRKKAVRSLLSATCEILNHEANIKIAKRLLDNGGLFSKDGIDNEGHVNNLAHPALTGLVINFFYTSLTSVGQLFPEVFSQEVLRVAVALTEMTKPHYPSIEGKLKVVLDETILGMGKVNFQVTSYSPVYVGILGLMSKCDTSPVHRAKMQALCIWWTELGSNGMARQEPVRSGNGFDVDLT
ncbi:hypothetical protein EV363DRAFT_1305046 [Boletus edulis]|nr:hypothetical protein EV363DRAFT_1305046 [Boletus edulis]